MSPLLFRRDSLDLLAVANLPQVASAPSPNCRNDGNKTSTLAGQAILHLGRNDVVILSVDEPAMRERLQFAAQDAGSYFLRPLRASQKAGPDLAIPERTILEVPHDSK